MFTRYVHKKGLTPLKTNKKYLINMNGRIFNEEGEIEKTEVDAEGFRTVKLHGRSGEEFVRVAWLMVIQYKGLEIPESDFDRIIPFHINGDKDDLNVGNIGYRFKDGPLAYKELNGFFYIPGFTSCVINEQGVLINTRTFNRRNFHISKGGHKNCKGGYFIATVPFDDKVVSCSRHRCLALTFLPYPDDVDSLVVNHKDGIPGNDTLDNLEWTTRRENNVHAYDTGLKSQNMPVLVRDVLTGEVTRYRSISDCAVQMGYPTDETIRQRIVSSRFGKIFNDGTQIKLESDTRDWIYPKNPEEAVKLAKTDRPIKVRDCLSLEVKEYPRISDAARELGILNSTISLRINGIVNSPLNGFQFKDIEDHSDWPEFTKQEYLDSLKPNSFKIHARNINTGETSTWESVRQAEEAFKRNTISHRLRDGQQPLYKDGWMFKYEDHDWDEIKDPEEALYKLQADIMFRREADGAIFISNKFKGYADTLGLHYQAAKAAAMTRGKAIYNGYRIRLGLSNDPWPTDDIKFNYKKWLKEHNA